MKDLMTTILEMLPDQKQRETLLFINYAANRDAYPDIPHQRWDYLYGDKLEALEARYQQELKGRDVAVSAGIAAAQRERLEGSERDGYGMNTRGGQLVPGR